MEYEIGDDPQGLLDGPDGDRDGGLRDHFVHRGDVRHKRFRQHDDARGEDSAPLQMGEWR